MKELSIEQKAKAYDNIRDKIAIRFGSNVAKEIFSEYEESEDERIRKELLSFCQNRADNYPNDPKYANIGNWIAWLEKQGESKVKEVSIWKHWKDGICGNGDGKQIYLIKQYGHYSISSCLGLECDYIELSELDKLMQEEKQGEQNLIMAKSPQLGEQKPTIEMKTPEESLGIDSDTYNKIVDECIYGEQNPIAWSEEDKNMLQSILDEYKSMPTEKRNWLKSLKERYTWKSSDEHYELEEFAKIVRGNLTGISKAVQKLFETKYLQLTGNKMYGGFKD